MKHRSLFGVGIILVSLFAATAFIKTGDKTSLYWVAKAPIAAGDRLTPQKLAQARLYLPGRDSFYLPADEDPMTLWAIETIYPGEAIARSEVRATADNALWRYVALELNRGDLPQDLSSATLVDIYQLPSDQSSKSDETQILLEGVLVDRMSDTSELSGTLQVILRLRLPQVRPLLDAYARSRIAITPHVR